MAMAMAKGGGGRRRGRRSKSAPMSEINVTPLVDVMLVLLIIFMVTAPLLKAGVPVELPESRAKALAEETRQVTIAMARDGKVYLDDIELAPGDGRDGRAEPRRVQPHRAGHFRCRTGHAGFRRGAIAPKP